MGVCIDAGSEWTYGSSIYPQVNRDSNYLAYMESTMLFVYPVAGVT